MTAVRSASFFDVLRADRPAADRADKMALYAFLIGSWDTDVVTYEENGASHKGHGEIHAGWVLEGRAVQDVWMIPPRPERGPHAPLLPVAGNWYGTTLRLYDPRLDAWHILWSDPAMQNYVRQIARARGNDVVQEGRIELVEDGELRPGPLQRWSFSDIAPDSFHWRGEVSADDGATWRLVVEIFARRVAA
jgi:hypothetical protein